LDDWQQQNLSKYKWLRGGIEVVKEVCDFLLASVIDLLFNDG